MKLEAQFDNGNNFVFVTNQILSCFFLSKAYEVFDNYFAYEVDLERAQSLKKSINNIFTY